ncbi:MAG: DNA repair protein RecN [Blautia sp.]
MLIHLHVKNLALIEEAEVDFGPGLNILTGETGAGKSILLGSMQLILGGKMSKEMIREKSDYALVELLFQVENPLLSQRLSELDIPLEEGQILLSRRIMDGRSVSKINGQTCTVGQMKAAAGLLLDIHGQHEHQSLLYPKRQLDILDAYGRRQIEPAKEKVREAFGEYRQIQRELSSMDMDEAQRNREQSLLEFQLEEIENAQLCSGEDEELERRYRKMNNSRKIVEALQKVHACTGYEAQGCAGELLGRALQQITQVSAYDGELGQLESMLMDVDGLLNDFNRELSSYLDGLVFQEEEFYQTEQRLDLINNLKAKYGRTVEDIEAFYEEQWKNLEKIRRYQESIQELNRKLKISQEKLENFSHDLSKIRKQYSQKLSKEIVEGLNDLNFLEVDFAISFEKSNSYSANGYDEVTYEISTNPGEPRKPFGKVVSGGELSRVMLAVKTILADKDEIDTLIFDEIDTGISGRTAQKVSEKMAIIGGKRQVICITHLPQIAAMADYHFEIKKISGQSETVTQIYSLDEEASVRELARMLGGAEITGRVLENAREMKELARHQKNTRLKK